MNSTIALTSLLGSRICHDLISPLGAIGNGVELLALSGLVAGPEMMLISESVENANARIRFFRIAFGAANEGAELARGEITSVLAALSKGGRLGFDWQIEGSQPRDRVKLAFLCILCCETAMPWGGKVSVRRAGEGWSVTAEGERLRDLPGLWAIFDAPDTAPPPTAAEIQFVLAPLAARDMGLRLGRTMAPGRITLTAT